MGWRLWADEFASQANRSTGLEACLSARTLFRQGGGLVDIEIAVELRPRIRSADFFMVRIL
jgi:hypothetical protein